MNETTFALLTLLLSITHRLRGKIQLGRRPGFFYQQCTPKGVKEHLFLLKLLITTIHQLLGETAFVIVDIFATNITPPTAETTMAS